MSEDNYVRWSNIALDRFLIASSALAVVDNLMFYPFDLLKTREHVDRANLQGQNPFRITWNQIRDAVRVPCSKSKSGFRIEPLGLYRGFWTSTACNLPNYVLYLAVYSFVKEELGYNPAEPHSVRTIASPILAGALADLASLALYVPAEVLTKRVQLKDSRFTNGFQAARWILQTQGWKGLYAGTGATILTSTIGSSVWWGVYEYTKGGLSQLDASPLRTFAAQIGSGAFATAVACTVVNPVDVVRSRLQTQEGQSKEYRNVFHGLRQVVRQEGFLSVTRGLLPKLVSRTPLGAITAYLYELVFRWSRQQE